MTPIDQAFSLMSEQLQLAATPPKHSGPSGTKKHMHSMQAVQEEDPAATPGASVPMPTMEPEVPRAGDDMVTPTPELTQSP